MTFPARSAAHASSELTEPTDLLAERVFELRQTAPATQPMLPWPRPRAVSSGGGPGQPGQSR